MGILDPNSMPGSSPPSGILGGTPSPQPSLMDQAKQQYPILQNHDIQYKYNPSPSGNYLEFWPPGETGDETYKRPQEFDLAKPGVEVQRSDTRPIDILGDVVSHHLINADPKIKGIYDQFQGSMQPWQQQILQEQYQHAQTNEGEKRSFDEWKSASGMPAYFRGYPFQQWKGAERMYTPEQLTNLDGMMDYLRGTGNERTIPMPSIVPRFASPLRRQ